MPRPPSLVGLFASVPLACVAVWLTAGVVHAEERGLLEGVASLVQSVVGEAPAKPTVTPAKTGASSPALVSNAPAAGASANGVSATPPAPPPPAAKPAAQAPSAPPAQTAKPAAQASNPPPAKAPASAAPSSGSSAQPSKSSPPASAPAAASAPTSASRGAPPPSSRPPAQPAQAEPVQELLDAVAGIVDPLLTDTASSSSPLVEPIVSQVVAPVVAGIVNPTGQSGATAADSRAPPPVAPNAKPSASPASAPTGDAPPTGSAKAEHRKVDGPANPLAEKSRGDPSGASAGQGDDDAGQVVEPVVSQLAETVSEIVGSTTDAIIEPAAASVADLKVIDAIISEIAVPVIDQIVGTRTGTVGASVKDPPAAPTAAVAKPASAPPVEPNGAEPTAASVDDLDLDAIVKPLLQTTPVEPIATSAAQPDLVDGLDGLVKPLLGASPVEPAGSSVTEPDLLDGILKPLLGASPVEAIVDSAAEPGIFDGIVQPLFDVRPVEPAADFAAGVDLVDSVFGRGDARDTGLVQRVLEGLGLALEQPAVPPAGDQPAPGHGRPAAVDAPTEQTAPQVPAQPQLHAPAPPPAMANRGSGLSDEGQPISLPQAERPNGLDAHQRDSAHASVGVQIFETHPPHGTLRGDSRSDAAGDTSAGPGDDRVPRGDAASSRAGPADARATDANATDAQPDARDFVAGLDVERMLALARSGSFEPCRWTPNLKPRTPVSHDDRGPTAVEPARRAQVPDALGAIERFDALPATNQPRSTPHPSSPLERLMLAPLGGVSSTTASGSLSTSNGGQSSAAPTLLSALLLQDTWRSVRESALLRPAQVTLSNIAPPG